MVEATNCVHFTLKIFTCSYKDFGVSKLKGF